MTSLLSGISSTDSDRRSTQVARTRRPSIAIIGAGFSGTLLALHLLRRCPGDAGICLIERNARFGRGLAYSTGNPGHLLNVPAGKMSAFADRPLDFLDWLRLRSPEDQGEAPSEKSFVPRWYFGAYVRHLLNAELRGAHDAKRLSLLRGNVIDLRPTPSGVRLALDRDRRLEVDIAVLATGNFPPEAPPIADPSFYETSTYRADPWAPDTLGDLDPRAAVLLIGTGLTMVDTVVSLLDNGHRGPIHALSRRGLLPHRHVAAGNPAPVLSRPLPTAIAALSRLIRAEIDEIESLDGDWRAVIDGLRPATQDVWQTMSLEDRARFLRHLRPWWDVHRHRMPASVADRIDRARAEGQLTVGAGRIRDMAIGGAVLDKVRVEYLPRCGTTTKTLQVARVINCSGPGCDYDRITDPLIRSLLQSGIVRADPLRLGLDVTPLCALRNGRGEIEARLYGVGPITKAAFWEMTSVPDIRRQCETLAGHLAGALVALQPHSAMGRA